MPQYNPTDVFITLHTTGGDHFTINPRHIFWIAHNVAGTEHTVYVNDGAGGPTAFVINHAHWLELVNASPFIIFMPDLSPEG